MTKDGEALTQAHISCVKKTLDLFDPASPNRKTIVVGGSALVYSLGSKGIQWTHPAIASGRTIDLDVLAPPELVGYYWRTWDAHFPEVKYATQSEYDDADIAAATSIQMAPRGKARRNGILDFTALSIDSRLPELNFDGIVSDPFATEIIGDVRVMSVEEALKWKALHAPRRKDVRTIESVLNANEEHAFLSPGAVQRIIALTKQPTTQDQLFD